MIRHRCGAVGVMLLINNVKLPFLLYYTGILAPSQLSFLGNISFLGNRNTMDSITITAKAHG